MSTCRRASFRLLPILVACSLWAATSAARDLPVETLRVPPGFAVTVFAINVPGARSMTLGARGTVFVGSRDAGTVYALTDAEGDGRAERTRVVARGLDSPNGVAFRDGSLYVAEISRILRFDRIEERLDDPPAPVIVNDKLPRENHHGWKFIRFGPDGLLYVPVGAPCNICDRRDGPFATIMRMRPDGSNVQVYAGGIRNTVGFDWHPESGDLWFTDNGRDWLGDDLPPDELNRAPKMGLHFGFPWRYGQNLPDPDWGDAAPSGQTFTPPAWEFGAHVAALGMRFYRGKMFPDAYRGRIVVAQHGSWNRSTPQGYRVVTVRLEGNRAVVEEPLVEGWLAGGKAWGRPVDVEQLPDGSLLISDDRGGCIYRLIHAGPK